MGKINICKLKEEYIEYLRKYDDKVDKNKGERRKYVGALLEINNLKYFAPLSSPKEKHKNMKENIDFVKLDNGNLGVINLNNMVPVNEAEIIYFDIDTEIFYDDPVKNMEYINLLKKQFIFISNNFDKIVKKSEKLYKIIKSGKQPNLANRCCKFEELEKRCNEYSEYKTLDNIAVTK